MNAQAIIQEITLSREDRIILSHLAKLYDQYSPQVFYMDFYELARGRNLHYPKDHPEHFPGIPGTTPQQWESFLDIPEVFRYRNAKIAKQAEFDALKALQSMKNKGDVAALKEIIKTSKQLQGNNQNKERYILTYVTPKLREEAQ
jgi:hypothetical protein